jgi:DNA invertase Pin-like site-specific DNA recombinase
MRVSTKDKQEFDRQIFVLKDYNLDRIFEEKISGTKKAASREAFQELLNVLVVGDEVYFESMSRMARSMQDLIDTTNVLVKQYKVKVIFVKENLAIGGGSGLDAMGALIFNIMGAFAQFERDLISDRTKTALSAKREQGIVLGRPSKTSQQTIDRIKDLREGGLTISEIANALEMPKSTVGRICKEENFRWT